ncbi:MobC family plasmid mobilization relaxosome protein [Ruminococcaceae bacterium OttesenSCG-928-A16]|nr:MobC family plasmid mobilization relaxosome protein [Ruminococcaceae bacterium OttesenSCG-928-A16]
MPLMFYVAEDEMAVINEKMKLLCTSNKSAYLRKSAIDGYVINIDTTDIKENTAQLQRIGNNVNQIVKRMNQTGSLYAADVAEVKELLKEIWHTQRYILLSQRWTRP